MNHHQIIELQDKMEHVQYVIRMMEEFLREVAMWNELTITIRNDNKHLFEEILDRYKEIYSQLVCEFEKL